MPDDVAAVTGLDDNGFAGFRRNGRVWCEGGGTEPDDAKQCGTGGGKGTDRRGPTLLRRRV